MVADYQGGEYQGGVKPAGDANGMNITVLVQWID